MILKVRSYDYQISGKKVSSWAHVDNISIIDVIPQPWATITERTQNGFNPDAIWFCTQKENREHPNFVNVATITLNNGEKKLYVFEQAYLLNDEGKTIERY
jgi:hypothetical protein